MAAREETESYKAVMTFQALAAAHITRFRRVMAEKPSKLKELKVIKERLALADATRDATRAVALMAAAQGGYSADEMDAFKKAKKAAKGRWRRALEAWLLCEAEYGALRSEDSVDYDGDSDGDGGERDAKRPRIT